MATKRSVGTLTEADLKGKKVFLRADLNVPLDDSQKITDDTRIRASVPTIKFLMEKGAKVILASHLGRPKGVTPKYSLKPLVPRLSELLGVNVVMANDCIGEEVQKLAASLPDGGVLLLENVRFYKEEEKNDPEFAKKLASVADLYVNDAFGTAHRAHASTEGVTKYLKPAVAGFLMQKELDYLVGAVANPKKPFAAIVGGSKVSTKIGVIESLLAKVDILILGGGMIFTFYKAQGYAVGKSLVEEDKLELATSLIEKAKSKGVSLLLPTDVVVADKFAADADSKTVPAIVFKASPRRRLGDAKSSERFLKCGVVLAVACSGMASPHSRSRRLGVGSAEADAASTKARAGKSGAMRARGGKREAALARGGKRGAASAREKEELHAYICRQDSTSVPGRKGSREGERRARRAGGVPEIGRRLRPRAATPAPSTSATSAPSTTVIPAPSTTAVDSTMASSSCITSDYDPKTDPARKGNVEDPGWKYAYWPNLQKKDVVACSLCGVSFYGGIKRVKKHLAGGFGDTKACIKTTTAIRMEMRDCLNGHA